MSYTPFDARVFPLFIFYIIIIVLTVFMTIKMFLKWRERKVTPPLYLAIAFAFFTSALIVLTLGLAEGVVTAYYKEVYRFSLPFAYSMVIISDFFLFKFASEITEKGAKLTIPLIVIGIVIVIMHYLPWNHWGVPSADYEGQLNIRIYTTICLVLYSNLIYLFIANICRKSMVSAVDKVTHYGLKLLFYSMICLVFFFIMFIIDTVLMIFVEESRYSIFIYIAWGSTLVFFTLAYCSLVMPDWLVKWIEKRSEK